MNIPVVLSPPPSGAISLIAYSRVDEPMSRLNEFLQRFQVLASSSKPRRSSSRLKSPVVTVVHYETLISAARMAYDEFLKGSEKADRLDQILRTLK